MRTRAWIGGFGLAALCGSVLALAACSSSDSNGGTGGSNQGKGGGSSNGGGGNVTGGTNSGNGGSLTVNGGGPSTGGSSASGGNSSTGGSSGFTCPGKVADCSVVSDFPTAVNMSVWGGTDFGGGITTFNGVVRDTTKPDVLHMTGVGNKYGGFGLWFNSCSDLSQYSGVSFKVSGTAGTLNTIDFQVQTNSDYPWQADMGVSKKGACTSPTPDNPWGDCIAPLKSAIPLTTTPTVVTVNWSDVGGGTPTKWDAANSPKEVVGLQWQFPAATAEYMVDVTVDDVTLLGGTQKTCATGSPAGGAGGAGGGSSNGGSSNGGSSNGGAGGASGGSSSGGAGGASGGSSNGGGSSGGASGSSNGGGNSAGAGGGNNYAGVTDAKDCNSYCTAVYARCPTQAASVFTSADNCKSRCPSWPTTGQDLACWITHVNNVTGESAVATHCPHATSNAMGVCNNIPQ